MREPVLQQSPTPKVHVDPLASILHDSRTGYCTTSARSSSPSRAGDSRHDGRARQDGQVEPLEGRVRLVQVRFSVSKRLLSRSARTDLRLCVRSQVNEAAL